MSIRIRSLVAIVVFFLLVGGAHAGVKLRVEKSAISVSPMSPAGTILVRGWPGSVYGVHPIHILVINKDKKLSREGVVLPNGSFAVTLRGYPDDDIKVKFTAANGKKKSVGLEVPEVAIVPPVVVPPPYAVESTTTVTEEVEVVQ